MNESRPLSLIRLFWSWRWDLRGGMLLAICRSFAVAPIPLIFKKVVDTHVPGKDVQALLHSSVYLMLMLALHYFFSTSGARHIGQVVANRIMELRARIFSRIQHLSFGYLDQQRTGRLVSKYAFDTQKVEGVAMQFLNQFIPSMFYGGSVACILVFLNWQLSVVLVFFIPLYAFMKGQFFERLKRRHRLSRVAQEKMTGTASELFGAIRLVRSFGTEEDIQSAMDESSSSVARAYVESVSMSSRFGTFIFVSMNFLTSLVILGGGYLAMTDAISMGTLIAFVAGIPILLQPVQLFSQMSDQYFLGTESYNSIQELLDSPFVEKWKGHSTIPAMQGAVEFRGVSFEYPSTGKAVIHDLNLTIRPGEKIALVGASGAGKSTLASLLLGLYEPSSGRILIDGIPQQELDMHWLRKQTSIVMQESILLSGSITDNIRFGRTDATDEEVRDAARRANATDFINSSPAGFDTVVGERGAMLSGGQKQRISIARAILRDPKILILDEPTSALDYESERLIQEALDRLARDRTVITIAHRLSTIKNSDRIISMHAGRIVDQGSYAELAGRPGYFRDLLESNLIKPEA